MKKSKRMKQNYLGTPQACLNQLTHHQISPISPFQNGFPDPKTLPSVASITLQSEVTEEPFLETISDFDVKLLQRVEDDSELDSAESDVDPLEHAGTYTAEEVSKIYLEKLQKLRSLYFGEYKRLSHLLKENKRQYLHAVKSEKETMASIHDQPKENVEERANYDRLKHLTNYHRRSGKEALFYKKYLEKKLQDDHQVLFRPCGSVQAGSEECETPIIALPHTPMCVYHTPMPSSLVLSEISRDDREPFPLPSNPNIIDLSETSAFVISEIPPENVMEDDGTENLPPESTTSDPGNSAVQPKLKDR